MKITNDAQAEVNRKTLLKAIQHQHQINVHHDVTIINMIYDTLYDLEAYNVYYVDEFFKDLDVSSLHPDIIGTIEGACSNLTMDSTLKQKFLDEAKIQYKEQNVSANAEERRSQFKWKVVDGKTKQVLYETKHYELYELLNRGVSIDDLKTLEEVFTS